MAKPPTRTVPAGSASGIEVEAGAFDGGQNRDGVVGQTLSGRRQTHPPALGLDQLRAGFPCERGDLLGHGGCGEVMHLGDRAHGTQPRQGQKQLQSSGVHGYRIRLSGENPSATASRDANSQRPSTGTRTSR